MKTKLNIPKEILKEEYLNWKDEGEGMTFREFVKAGWECDLNYNCMLNTSGMMETENFLEWDAMTREEQMKELEVRIDAMLEETAEAVGVSVEELLQVNA